MRALLTQKEQRQLRILEYLFENPDWIHLDPLAEDLDINTRIIKSDARSPILLRNPIFNSWYQTGQP